MKNDTMIPFSTGVAGLEGDVCGIGLEGLRGAFGPCLKQRFDLTGSVKLLGGKKYAAIKLPEGAVPRNIVLHVLKEKAGATLNVGKAVAGTITNTAYKASQSLAAKGRFLYDAELGTSGVSGKWIAGVNDYITIDAGTANLDGVAFVLYVSLDYVCAPTDVNAGSAGEPFRAYPDPQDS